MEKNVTEHKLFYKEHYGAIKQTEQHLLAQIEETLRPINEHRNEKIVEHIISRIKTPGSTIEKLLLAGHEPSEENAINILSDVVGIRLIVHFIGDIYTIRNLLVNNKDYQIVKEKDYVRDAKETGYRGYHIILNTNFNHFPIRAEIQIRTIAMDCWASLEHLIRYKKVVKNTELIDMELRKCSDDLMSADIAMEQILGLVRRSTIDEYDDSDFFNDAMHCLENQRRDS